MRQTALDLRDEDIDRLIRVRISDPFGQRLPGQRRRTQRKIEAARAQRQDDDDTIAAILARVPMRLWQVELLALEDLPRLRLS